MLLSLILKEKNNFKLFYYIHIVEISTTKKGANSYKLKLIFTYSVYRSHRGVERKIVNFIHLFRLIA